MKNNNLLLETFKCNPSSTFFLCIFIMLFVAKIIHGSLYSLWAFIDFLMICFNIYNLNTTYQELKLKN